MSIILDTFRHLSVLPEPEACCAVPFVSAECEALAMQSRCRDGQEPVLARRKEKEDSSCLISYRRVLKWGRRLLFMSSLPPWELGCRCCCVLPRDWPSGTKIVAG